jgi:nickel/cobalt exporter
MPKLAVVFITILFLGLGALAHPLGNFSVNQFARIEVQKSEIRIHYVLNLAEIPTFQELQTGDAAAISNEKLNEYAARITPETGGNLSLAVDNQALPLRLLERRAGIILGEGNLPTLRVEWDWAADLPASDANAVRRVVFENKNNLGRVGWNEIVVARAVGVAIFDSTAFGNSLSDELKNYPESMLTAPLLERRANFSFAANLPPNAKPLQNRDGKAAAPVQREKLAELLGEREITLPLAILALIFAFGFGAAHALSPGHGKTVVGAYLVGSRGTWRHAVFLGLTVTVTHTLGVFALGLITLFAANYVLPEKIMPFLNFVSGLLVFFIGLTLFKDRLQALLKRHSHDDAHHHHHEHHHEHGEDWHTHDGVHYHSHRPPDAVTWRSLLALGVSGGLLPCPSALVLMLAAISQNKTAFGLILIVAFSFGLAATLTAIGLVFLHVGKFFERPALSENRLVKTLPVVSAFVIACVGAAICYSSLA